MRRDRSFRHSPHVDAPDMSLRYHLCDPVRGELILTASTQTEAIIKALAYQEDRHHLDFVEIYDEKLLRTYVVPRPNERSPHGMRHNPKPQLEK